VSAEFEEITLAQLPHVMGIGPEEALFWIVVVIP
jgi:hypothetical protein